LKWDKRIEPLKFSESKQNYIAAMEQIAVTVSGYFFDLLLAQVNFQIAETNLLNTKQIQRVADEKFELGKVSKNEILQLQTGTSQIPESGRQGKKDMEIAMLNLRSYIGLQAKGKLELELPPAIIGMQVTADRVLAEAYVNNANAIAFIRKVIEARRDVAQAKGDNGLNATLTANLGLCEQGLYYS